MPSVTDLCFQSATALASAVRGRGVSAAEIVEAHLRQIERLNPSVNAVCTLAADRAIARAGAIDRSLARGDSAGPLAGVPVVIKDLVLTQGIRTTFGSLIYKDLVPDITALHVERLEAAGAIVIGKSNTPEFGAGSQTYNEVFGATRNPYDPTKTCGGSTGGGAAALACGMAPLADGSDLGGSLRNPASFCNVVGLRPSPGRVPIWPATLGWQSLSVLGPMARSAADAALLLSGMAGPDPRAPLSLADPGEVFARPLDRDFTGCRVAWTPDLGRYPVDPVVADICGRAARALADLGCEVDEAHPDVSGADDTFQVLRAALFAAEHAWELERHRHLMKDTVVWNIEKGLTLDALAVSRAERERTKLRARVAGFMERYEFLVLPAAPVQPFPVEQHWISEINGVRLPTYIDWMALCYVISLAGLPAASAPCGFTPDGLPVGLQIVGRPWRDFDVLQLVDAVEAASPVGRKRPPIC